MGCIGRRAAPGAPAPPGPPGPPLPNGGRGPLPGAPGRWKMGRRAACPGAGGGAAYVGRGPVCGMMTRRTGASGTGGGGGASTTGGGGGGTTATGAAGTAALTGGRATTTPAGGGVLLAMAGRSPGVPGRTTTPAGGRAPSAGRGVGCTIDGACRTCGTTRRGASPGAAEPGVRGCAIFRVGITGRAFGARAGTSAGATGGGATA